MLVVGDVMLDEYLHGEVSRISPEAPVPVVEVKNTELRLGGAANAAANIQTLGDLVTMSEADVLKIKNFGKTSLKEIKKKLGDMGLSFGMQVPEEAGVPAE